jgi:hypothetical protein
MSAYQTTIDELICECKPCPECEGEGEISTYVPGGYYKGRGLNREYELVEPCRVCHGTGKDAGDCAIHDRRESAEPMGAAFDPRFGITAAQLGIAEPVCDFCTAGDHEVPKMTACACACHGVAERTAA